MFDRLIDDAGLAAAEPDVDTIDVLRAHRSLRAGPTAAPLGPLIVPDRRLAELARAAGEEAVEVVVVNTGGAGGLVALAGRTVPGVEVVAVQSALRDLDDLAGNAARVVSAAGELDDGVTVFVEIPYAPGWVRAVEEVEAAGLSGAVRIGGIDAGRLAEQLSVLVEADLPFAIVDGPDRALSSAEGPGFVPLMLALEALIDGAAAGDAAELLTLVAPDRVRAAVGSWDGAAGGRIRRRLRSITSRDAAGAVEDLRALGLAGPS